MLLTGGAGIHRSATTNGQMPWAPEAPMRPHNTVQLNAFVGHGKPVPLSNTFSAYTTCRALLPRFVCAQIHRITLH